MKSMKRALLAIRSTSFGSLFLGLVLVVLSFGPAAGGSSSLTSGELQAITEEFMKSPEFADAVRKSLQYAMSSQHNVSNKHVARLRQLLTEGVSPNAQMNLNGKRYEGEFRDGKRHGHGTSTTADGSRYEGEFRDGKLHGHGTYTGPYGDRYEGEWRDNALYNGVKTAPTGARAEGEFRDGLLYNGTYTLPTGARAEGEFRDGLLYNGTYTFNHPDGTIRRLQYRNGEFVD